jgi:hypothetical protein
MKAVLVFTWVCTTKRLTRTHHTRRRTAPRKDHSAREGVGDIRGAAQANRIDFRKAGNYHAWRVLNAARRKKGLEELIVEQPSETDRVQFFERELPALIAAISAQ